MLMRSITRRSVSKKRSAIRNFVSDVGTILAFAVIGAMVLSATTGCHRLLLLHGPRELVLEQ